MKLKIMVDSSSGITQDEAARLGIDVFPLRIIFNEKEYCCIHQSDFQYWDFSFLKHQSYGKNRDIEMEISNIEK